MYETTTTIEALAAQAGLNVQDVAIDLAGVAPCQIQASLTSCQDRTIRFWLDQLMAEAITRHPGDQRLLEAQWKIMDVLSYYVK